MGGRQMPWPLGLAFLLSNSAHLTFWPRSLWAPCSSEPFRKASTQPSELSTTGLGGALRKSSSPSPPTRLCLAHPLADFLMWLRVSHLPSQPCPSQGLGWSQRDMHATGPFCVCTPRVSYVILNQRPIQPPSCGPPCKHAPRNLPQLSVSLPGSKAVLFTLKKPPLNMGLLGLSSRLGTPWKRTSPQHCHGLAH